ncbi:hypothetical protein PBCV1_a585R [Paramecium bursaria Chlorella virus 1]|uniref:Uncharacterized protein n=1 Tax=Paramecium bursaria Chlorella virus 1 TaxID=10506 RepID=O41067_PBCV1|nr:hypothetical protein PBCV1_a585R [Paramecium bursaria Chlorella virus 1]AAC97011.2 hypothetical protein [Paramecium bursaria Chlorella virus 1]
MSPLSDRKLTHHNSLSVWHIQPLRHIYTWRSLHDFTFEPLVPRFHFDEVLSRYQTLHVVYDVFGIITGNVSRPTGSNTT